MKLLSITIGIAFVNLVMVSFYAAGKFGPTPLFLPLILVIACCCVLILCVKHVLRKHKHKKLGWRIDLLILIIWLCLVIFNLYNFQLILYVA